jgi:hypothetical protein
MAKLVGNSLDFNNASRVLNLPAPASDNEPARRVDLETAVQGLKQKDPARVRTTSNINLASPGTTLDGITMAAGNRVVVSGQTAGAENGVYVWNGGATPMTRALDANTATELNGALIPVLEGTSAGVNYRQTATITTLGTDTVTWASFGTVAGAASETSAGILEIATQAETDAATLDNVALTPLKAKTASWMRKAFAANIGDGSATSYAVTHNFNTRDVQVQVFRNSGNYDDIIVDVERTTVNAVTVIFSAAPTSNQFRVLVGT